MVAVPPMLPGTYRVRCAACHRGTSPADPELLYNLTIPDQSLELLAPLAKAAGGYELCSTRAGSAPVYADRSDRDYQGRLEAIRGASRRLEEIKRFDMPGFRPSRHYVREMRRYGVLEASIDPRRDAIDVYETDRVYWKSFWLP